MFTTVGGGIQPIHHCNILGDLLKIQCFSADLVFITYKSGSIVVKVARNVVKYSRNNILNNYAFTLYIEFNIGRGISCCICIKIAVSSANMQKSGLLTGVFNQCNKRHICTHVGSSLRLGPVESIYMPNIVGGGIQPIDHCNTFDDLLKIWCFSADLIYNLFNQ